MKKIISLLLVIALSVGLLTCAASAVSFEKPDECTQADAAIKITDKNGDSYYFDNLYPAAVHWARRDLPGAKTITLLKDLTLDAELSDDKEQRYIDLTPTLADWNGRNGTKNPLIFDLGGNTLTYKGTGAIFYCSRYAFTLKNGTIDYSSEGRSCIAIGTSTGATAISSGGTAKSNLYQPTLSLEDVTIIANNGSCVLNMIWGTTINIKNSTLLAKKGTALNMGATNQTKINSSAKPFEGEFIATVNAESSALISAKNYPVNPSHDGYTVNVFDCLLVSGKEAAFDPNGKFQLDTKGLEVEAKGAWSGTYGGTDFAGNSFAIGENPLQVELPFTDVKEGDWFFQFVSEMYGKKIIAGQTATTFNPNGNLTYGAALKLLTVGVNGKDVGNATSGHWATNYLNEAVAAGWTTIGADKLDAPVTREAFCEIAAKAKGLTEKAENPFKDTTNDAVLALVKAGVISGMSADTFNPTGVLTRAQIAKIISLLIKL